MADIATNNLADYIKGMGINISALSRGSGISDNVLRRSIVRKERDLRAEKFMDICQFLRKDPFDFYHGTGHHADTGQSSE